MIATIERLGQHFRVDFSRGRSIAIALDPHGPQPAFFGSPPATAEPLSAGDYIGDISQGGSCNAEVIRLIPHCHGTHTECIGHIDLRRQSVQDTIYPEPCLARLISLRGEAAGSSSEHYPAALATDQRLLTQTELAAALEPAMDSGAEAVIIRTLPNDDDKTRRDYASAPAYPIFSSEAISYAAGLPLKHLLIDTPSLDLADDQGRLSNHRIWWNLCGSDDDWDLQPARRSITEMIFVADAIEDGLYWLQLELSPIVSDATPSRPLLYPLEKV